MKAVVTGGAGFIGCNLAADLAERGHSVTVFDNLSRRGSKENWAWLKKTHPRVQLVKGDVRRQGKALDGAFRDAEAIYHLAGQVAVTTSVEKPCEDFESNALGTFNVLEAARRMRGNPAFIYSSTNKVYGGMENVKVVKKEKRYAYRDYPNGIPESMTLDFHSPYGCSKGCADQYVRDYHRIYGVKSVVFRQSAIYGEHQMGVEDQGWVAWFTIATLLGKKITIYGDGKQVRDVLYVGDLVEAFNVATRKIWKAKGKIYNVGGGPKNTLSLLELLDLLEKKLGKRIPRTYSKWRPGDQPVYVSDVQKISRELGWKPHTSVRQGVDRLVEWVSANEKQFERMYPPKKGATQGMLHGKANVYANREIRKGGR